jgi:non-ribosomal peptide synthase protein (TIGR01720 family)
VSAGQLHVSWIYSEDLHHRSTIEGLANSFLDTLRLVVGPSQSAESEAHTTSDFPAARLDERQLEEFLSILGQAEESGSK